MSTLCKQKGFTLIEMTVSLGLFTIIMFIATSAFLSIVNTDRKTRSVRIAADNLNISLEDMTRRIKTGSSYYCGEYASGTQDCASIPGNALSFNDDSDASVRVIYRRVVGSNPVPGGCGVGYTGTQGCILRDNKLITSPEVDITSLKFIVTGSAGITTDTIQPMVVIVIDGSLGSGPTASNFKMQTTVTQRAYDNQ